MIRSAIALIQRTGAAAVTVDAVLSDSGAPRGSVYHHFPGGRDQIVYEALRYGGEVITEIVVQGADVSPHKAVDAYVSFWRHLLTTSDFTMGCPVAGAAVGGAEADVDMRDMVATIFDEWHTVLTTSLRAWGVDRERSASLSTMVIAAFEGALILARAQRSMVPLERVAGEVRFLISTAAPTSAASAQLRTRDVSW